MCTCQEKQKYSHMAESKLVTSIYFLLHLVILQTLLSKATYNWGIHKAINLEEAYLLWSKYSCH